MNTMPPIVSIVGGEATRLYPLTLNTSKFMLEVAGKPFIGHQLDLIKREGITDVILCTGRKGEEIVKYVKDGRDWGLSVEYVPEGPVPLGTGGAVKNAFWVLPDVFFVIYGDSYLDIPFRPVYERFLAERKPALMTVYHNKNEGLQSNVAFNDGKITKYDKTLTADLEYVDFGLSVFHKSAFESFPEKSKFGLDEVQRKLVQEGKLAGLEIKEKFHEIGSFEGLRETSEYINMSKNRSRSKA